MKLFIIITAILITLIFYLIYLLYYKFTNDTINNISVTETLKEVDKLTSNKIDDKPNITISLKHNNSIFNIEVQLFDDDLPITCKNFRHLAYNGIKNKTYKNTNFYKIVDDKFIEGGDILNNDGTGVISLYGKYFIDESFEYTHSSPGLLSMVNDGPNKNNSKFIITTRCCPCLDGKQVVFGRVISGMYHLFNLMKVNTDDNNEPLNPIEIIDIT